MGTGYIPPEIGLGTLSDYVSTTGGNVGSLQDMAREIRATLASVPGMAVSVIGEPTAIHATPAVFTSFDRMDRDTGGEGSAQRIEWRWTHILAIQWHDYEQSEMKLLGLVNAVCAAIEQNDGLGGLLGGGVIQITAGDAGYTEVGGTTYRTCEFTSVASEWLTYPDP
jgi:hypothetical protein